jgi:hypothetical protein
MREVIAVYFACFAALVVLVSIAQWRFARAYRDRYGGPEARRRRWAWPIFPADTVRPPWSLGSWFRPFDDPLVEHRRRQHLLAWSGVAVWFAIPVALILLSVLFRR